MNERLTIEKETASFLRIGSLNVRVKKTTEAFNNLMTSAGIASGIASGSAKMQDRLNKPWGSVDNLQTNAAPTVELQIMGPPKQTAAKKKRPIRDTAPFISLPLQNHQMQMQMQMQMQHDHFFTSQPPLIENKEEYETDSDSAYGFGNGWTNS